VPAEYVSLSHRGPAAPRRALHPEAVPLHPRACPGPHPGKDLTWRPPATRKNSRAAEGTSSNPCPCLVLMTLDRMTARCPIAAGPNGLP
jgi:hypothetical protein